MRIQLISHASVIVESSDTRIWTDPWLSGKAFNESWSLHPEPAFDTTLLDDIDYLWISHEHPDHFHIPTLRSLPQSFKERVVVLFQENNSTKMLDAFKKFGFPKQRLLPHRKRVQLSPRTEVYCYQVGQMDSCLSVVAEGETILNVNDSPISSLDCRRILKDIGSPDVVLNQFSIAGYGGFEDYKTHLRSMANGHLKAMLQNHRDLQARITIPFASFIRFCTEDNDYMNEFANRPRDVYDYFAQAGEETAILYPGDTVKVGTPHDSGTALARFEEADAALDRVAPDRGERIPLELIEEAFRRISADVHEKYPPFLLRRLKPVTAVIPDLRTAVRFSFASQTFEEIAPSPDTDLVVRSQPLAFAFSNPFGVQTLGVSARFMLRRNCRNWALHRVLFGLYNAEFHLRPKYLFRRTNVRYLYRRRRDLLDQIVFRLAVMADGR